MASRDERAAQAQKTLEYFDKATGSLAAAHAKALSSSTLYTEEMLAGLPAPEMLAAPVYELTDESVMDAIIRLDKEKAEDIAVLNFASARNAGGGFLNGSVAQEESLAASSNLYLIQTLPANQQYYEANWQFRSTLYTDHMIFSRDTVFVRKDTGPFWDSYITANVLTAPAVNYGVYIQKGGERDTALSTMKKRMQKLIKVFASERCRTLILGAYGCGVFKNDPAIVAGFFADILLDDGWGRAFDRIVFAVFDRSKGREVFTPFKDIFIERKLI